MVGRVNSLCDLMYAAYDAEEIRAYCRGLGHVPIIDFNPAHRANQPKRSSAKQRHTAFLPMSSRTAALPLTHDCRSGVCAAQGGVRRPSSSGTGACEGAMPPRVQHPAADGQPVDGSAATASMGLVRPRSLQHCPHGEPGTTLPTGRRTCSNGALESAYSSPGIQQKPEDLRQSSTFNTMGNWSPSCPCLSPQPRSACPPISGAVLLNY